jgi:hypothetical protein
LKTITCLFLTGCLLMLMGAAPSTGGVNSPGDFRVIEATSTRSVVQLGDAQLTLLPGSRAKVYSDHTILEKGASVVRNQHMIEAATLQISPAKDAVVQVEMTGPSTVSVFARGGATQVRNSSGVLVASLRTGMAVAFTPQAGAATAVKMTGPVTTQDGKYYLVDNTTRVKIELRGENLKQHVGKTVTVTGSSIPGAAATAGATRVVQVTSVAAAAAVAGAAAGGAAAAAAGAAAGGAAAAGIGTAATVAIVGGVAAAATVGGMAAAGTFSGSNP